MTEHAVRTPGDLAYFERILEHLQETRGFDFTAYKRATLLRRLSKRMQAVGVATFEAYLDYIQVHQDEFAALFNTILINVTSFFRDPEVWDHVAGHVLPALIQKQQGPIRVWSAGCAGGHEPYTVAMLLAEQIGIDGLRERVKIYATDVDDEALAEGRTAIYSSRQVASVPAPLLDKYFDRAGANYAVQRELRRAVIFGRHDLVQDAPISRVDLLLCRNTLMYFNTEAQSRILARFFFSLNPGGYLLLGRAELLFSHAATFTAVDLKRRLFRAVAKPNHRDRLLLLAQTGRDIMANNTSNQARLREAAFETDVMPQIVVDVSGLLAAVNAPARQLFGLTPRDLGRPLQDFPVSYRPVELRGAIDRVVESRREVILKEVPWSRDSETRFFDVTVSPLLDEDALVGTRLTFRDITDVKSLQEELQHSKQELETAYEELQSTNEELETTNEELQSTVEELETTNEELQSTNEELETMNEELQSTNEELQTMNDELRNRSTDLNSAHSFLESVFASLRSAVVVLDGDYRVLVWNERATDLWGLRSDEAHGRPFLNLDIGLPVGDLRAPVRAALAGDGHPGLVVKATNRRGRAIECRISVAPLVQPDRSVRGVILLMDEIEAGARAGAAAGD
jgi:two-component system CheB/CheR fusion protein